MALRVNSPNGTIKVPTNFQQAKKSWVYAVLEGSTKISSLIADPTQRTLNTLANSEPENLTPSAKLPPPNDPVLILPSFDVPFAIYPTLPPSAKILKISLSGLAQLHADMTNNFSQFGTIVDCGYVTGSSGLYAGGGYAVLALSPSNSTHSSVKLSHSLNWYYQPLNYSSDTGTLSFDFDHVSIFATWAAMPPFCQYCHLDKHALIDCDLRKKATMCCLCNDGGHIAKSCPRKNESSVTSQKHCKIPAVQETPQPSTPSSSIVVPPLPSSSSTDVPTTTGRVKRIQGSLERSVTCSQASLVVPNAPHNPNPIKEHKLPLPCQYCGLLGHQCSNHNACLKNPRYIQKETTSDDMETDFDDSNDNDPLSADERADPLGLPQ
ncbi:hypothetical protein F4703DRAFT_1980925 [Phycomyces blakesleeanus]